VCGGRVTRPMHAQLSSELRPASTAQHTRPGPAARAPAQRSF
jgi:hypothetical protein